MINLYDEITSLLLLIQATKWLRTSVLNLNWSTNTQRTFCVGGLHKRLKNKRNFVCDYCSLGHMKTALVPSEVTMEYSFFFYFTEAKVWPIKIMSTTASQNICMPRLKFLKIGYGGNKGRQHFKEMMDAINPGRMLAIINSPRETRQEVGSLHVLRGLYLCKSGSFSLPNWSTPTHVIRTFCWFKCRDYIVQEST